MEDGPTALSNMAKETTKEQMIPRECSCGWKKKSQPHPSGQGQMQWWQPGQACTVNTGQTRRSLSQVEHHSARVHSIFASGRGAEQQPSQQDELHHLPKKSCLKGSLASKLKLSGHIPYEEGTQRFGTKPKRRTRLKEIGRRERVIDQLVKVYFESLGGKPRKKSWRR